MSVKELEARLTALERKVRELSSEVTSKRSPERNWRRAVEKYAGDEDLLAVMAEAQKLRENDRQRARSRARGKSKK